jgi:hypothetical protein
VCVSCQIYRNIFEFRSLTLCFFQMLFFLNQGTGCRSAANWFLVASDKGIGNKLMRKWYEDMKETWISLVEDSKYKLGSGLQFWRYFEMDCSLTNLRLRNQLFDEVIINLAPFPVGNLGDPGTPHECLNGPVNLNGKPMITSWMLKLKGDFPNIEEYKTFLDERTSEKKQVDGTSTSTASSLSSIPRIIWMFWFQNESDNSLKPRDRACIEGWRRLNPSWEVRLLDADTGCYYYCCYYY